MNIYLVTTKNCHYEEYRGAVIVAESSEKAIERMIKLASPHYSSAFRTKDPKWTCLLVGSASSDWASHWGNSIDEWTDEDISGIVLRDFKAG